MKIRPLLAYHHAGHNGRPYQLDPGKVYDARPATNQPDHESNGAIFVSPDEGPELLLVAGEYTLIVRVIP